MERLQVILAGRAAEEVAYQVPSSYSIRDLKVIKSARKLPDLPSASVASSYAACTIAACTVTARTITAWIILLQHVPLQHAITAGTIAACTIAAGTLQHVSF